MRSKSVKKPPTDSLEALIAQRGLRMTSPRRIIARVLEKSADHPDVSEIHMRVSAIDGNISIATVYRTLKLFHEIGVLDRHDFDPETIKGGGKGRWRYEPVDKQEHYHLIDVKTGKIIEFESKALDKLQKTIAEQHGYELYSQKIELYGIPAKKKGA